MDLAKYPNVKVLYDQHAMIAHKITILRDKNTGSKEFRELVEEITYLVGYEAMRDLDTDEIEVETPMCTTKGKEIRGKKLVIVPILRAGLGMYEGLLRLVPAAKVGHIGLFRDPKTHIPVPYYSKLPEGMDEREVFVVDPMLATGGSASAAINFIKEKGCKKIHFLCIIAAPEGIKVVHNAHPDVDIIIGALDSRLNENAYIIPGLGDAGDRLYGTK
ncbi:uracil phosphoribosyltransferase [Candidatus Saccharibacteria bacterium]|nr:uracil phosphoribosyltransferase [Candidatus Saccharibacteria bacterium]